MATRIGTAKAQVSVLIPYHLRQRVAKDAVRCDTSLSAVVAAILAKHYGTTVEEPTTKKGGRA